MSELLKWKQTACEAAQKASALLLSMRQNFSVREKARFDLVTDADTASQKIIKEHLHGAFPHHDFLGEEDGKGEKEPAHDAPPTWIVDPIDGTTNYVHDLPLYAVSIGLWHQGKMKVGVVMDPARNEMFHAASGHGAFLNAGRLVLVEEAGGLVSHVDGGKFSPFRPDSLVTNQPLHQHLLQEFSQGPKES